MNRVAIILAGGKGKRWKGKEPKQLIRVYGEKLIHRTCRQLEQHGWNVVVATDDKNIANHAKHIVDSVEGPIIVGAYATSSLWGKRTLIIHGDVFFDDITIERINLLKSNLRVFGRGTDVFGIMFTDKIKNKITYTMHMTAFLASRGECHGNLFDFYKNYCNNYIFYNIDLPTQDFDTVGEYKKWLKQLEKHKREK